MLLTRHAAPLIALSLSASILFSVGAHAQAISEAHPGDNIPDPRTRSETDRTGRCAEPGTFWHRQARDCLHEIDTDRPHRTDTPATVPPGYVQAEFGMVSYEAATGDAGRTLHFLDLLFKVGMSPRYDLEVGYSPVTMRQRADRAGWLGGVNDLYGRSLFLRSKIRLLGDQESRVALSVAPIVAVPLTGDVELEFGTTLLFGVELTDWLSWELNASFFYEAQEQEHARAVHAVPCTALTARIHGPLKVFGEVYLERPVTGASKGWTGTVDGGLLYLLTNDMQLDAGIYLGMSDPLPAYTAFLGFSFRL
jgi:hypothetical protein